MTKNGGTANFHIDGLPAAATAEVLGESRSVTITNGDFHDDFTPFAVHKYVIHKPQ
jgi:hypothetical protein